MRTDMTTLVTVLAMLFGNATLAHDFSWDNLLLARMKLDKAFDYDAHVDSYMQAFRPAVWKRYRSDEFALEDKRQETVKIMQERVADFALDETFSLNANLTFGKYDFAAGEFPVEEASENHYWYESKYGVGDLPSHFRVYFRNPELIASVSMPKETARLFVQRRKDRYGNVNRQVQATIRFTIVKLKNGKNEFLVRIESAKFFDDEGRNRLIADIERAPATRRTSDEN